MAALDQLGSRPPSLAGMEALHDFLTAHPGVQLEPFLAGANDRLRAYFYEVTQLQPCMPVPKLRFLCPLTRHVTTSQCGDLLRCLVIPAATSRSRFASDAALHHSLPCLAETECTS